MINTARAMGGITNYVSVLSAHVHTPPEYSFVPLLASVLEDKCLLRSLSGRLGSSPTASVSPFPANLAKVCILPKIVIELLVACCKVGPDVSQLRYKYNKDRRDVAYL